jgi:sugar phosphate isomerase/epimerase
MRIAAQFYTLRDFTKTPEGFDECLQRVAEIGYEGVQLSAVGCMNNGKLDARSARQMLDKYGLRCCATHRPWESLRDETSKEIEFHKVLGCDYTAIGSMPKEYTKDGLAGWRRWRDEASALNLGKVRLGYHNHAHEFEPLEGGSAYSVFFEEGCTIPLEIDTMWVQFAGEDPAEWLRKASGRIQAIHLKDMTKDRIMAPVGEGILNWKAILAACDEGGTEWGIVEQDECQRDPFDCLRSSYEYLKG